VTAPQLDAQAAQTAPGSATEPEVIAAVTALLLAGTSIVGVSSVIGRLPGLTPALVEMALRSARVASLINEAVVTPEAGRMTPAARVKRYTSGVIAQARAAYLVRASRRLAYAAFEDQTGAALAKARKAEARYRANHRLISQSRRRSGYAVTRAIGRRRPDAQGRIMLGWYHTRPDQPPCPQCAPYVGRNFDALRPPVVGYPGMVHPHDYCKPGPPIGVRT
jgi:hypothetical protein